MKTKILLTLLIISATSIFGQIPTKLKSLKEKYESAKQKALDPIERVYKDELKKLLAEEKDVNEIAKITDELTKQGVDGLNGNKQIVKTEEVTGIEERWFVNKSWKTNAGTSFHFERDGKGYRKFGADKTNFLWKNNGTHIEVTGQVNVGKPVKNWYFAFKSKDIAFYGDTKDQITVPLQKD